MAHQSLIRKAGSNRLVKALHSEQQVRGPQGKPSHLHPSIVHPIKQCLKRRMLESNSSKVYCKTSDSRVDSPIFPSQYKLQWHILRNHNLHGSFASHRKIHNLCNNCSLVSESHKRKLYSLLLAMMFCCIYTARCQSIRNDSTCAQFRQGSGWTLLKHPLP